MAARIALVFVALAAVAAAVWLLLRTDDAPAPATTWAGPPSAAEAPADAPAAAPAKTPPRRRRHRAGTGAVAGTVREYGGGAPVVGAELVLESEAASLETRTGSDGSFALPKVAAGEWTLRVRAGGRTTEVGGIAVADRRTADLGTIYLAPAFAVPGVVEGAAGAPGPGATVRALRGGAEGARLDFGRVIRDIATGTVPAVETTQTGADGTFGFSRLTPGVYDLEAWKPGLRVTMVRDVVVTPEAAARALRIVLPPGLRLEGKVVRRGPGAVEGIDVAAIPRPDLARTGFDLRLRLTARTDAEGRFDFDGLPPGDVVVVATPEDEPFAVADDVELPRTQFVEITIGGDATLSGVVRAKDGPPVAGANVNLMMDKGGASATSDAAGRYEIRGLAPGRVQMTIVEAEGFATWPSNPFQLALQGDTRLELAPGPNTRDFELEPGGTVRGVVVEKEGGAPVSGATVAATGITSLFGGARPALTDADGRFELRGLAVGPTRLDVTKEGLSLPGSKPANPLDALRGMMGRGGGDAKDPGAGPDVVIETAGSVVERRLEMVAAATVRGVVRTRQGEPVPGADVRLVAEGGDRMESMFGEIAALLGGAGARHLTDAQGRFSLTTSAGIEKARVVARARGLLESKSEVIDLGDPAATAEVVVTLRVPGAIEGRVTDERGRPVAGASVSVASNRSEGLIDVEISHGAAQATSGEDGRFRVDEVEPGEATLRVRHARFLTATAEVAGVVEGGVANVDVRLVLGGGVAGAVVGPDGRPFEGASILVQPVHVDHDAPMDFAWQDTRSGPDGTFRREGLPAGRYSVAASAEGFTTSASAEVTVSLGDTASAGTLHLQTALRIAGVVRMRGGGPVEGVEVTARGVGDTSAEDTTGDDGAFEIEDLAAGTYVLEARAPSFAFGPSGRPNVRRASVEGVRAGTEGLVIEVEPGLVVRGAVVGPGGAEIDGGFVHVRPKRTDTAAATDGEPEFVPSTTIQAGKFEVVGLDPGEHVLAIQAPGYARKEVEVSAGTTDLRVALERAATGTVRGVVVLPDGRPAAEAFVELGDEVDALEETDAQGRFEITDVPVGRHTASADFDDEDGVHYVGEVTGVEVRESQATENVTIQLRRSEE